MANVEAPAVNAASPADGPASLPTEATPSESLPGFTRRCVVKPLSSCQLASFKVIEIFARSVEMKCDKRKYLYPLIQN